MELKQFIQDIIQQGKVTVNGNVTPFSDEDLQAAILQLREHYERQKQELAETVPAFDAAAAIWAAGFLYRAVQLVMLRHLGEDASKRRPATCPVLKQKKYASCKV